MKYRIAFQKKRDGDVWRPTPIFRSYDDADKRTKIDNEKYPDIHHWAEPAPGGEMNKKAPTRRKRKLAYIIVALAVLLVLGLLLDITNAPAIPMDAGH